METSEAEDLTEIDSSQTLTEVTEIIEIDLTEDDPLKCQDCSKIFKNALGLKVHWSIIHRKPVENIQRIETPNLQSKSKSKVYKCSQCKSNFKEPGRLYTHMMSHGHSFKCLECRKSFKSQNALNGHHIQMHRVSIIQHTNPKIKTPQSQQSTDNQTETQTTPVPVEIDMAKRPTKCPKCPKAYATDWDLNQHFLKSHANDSDNFMCEICGHAFMSEFVLEIHTAVKHCGDGNTPENQLQEKSNEFESFRNEKENADASEIAEFELHGNFNVPENQQESNEFQFTESDECEKAAELNIASIYAESDELIETVTEIVTAQPRISEWDVYQAFTSEDISALEYNLEEEKNCYFLCEKYSMRMSDPLLAICDKSDPFDNDDNLECSFIL